MSKLFDPDRLRAALDWLEENYPGHDFVLTDEIAKETGRALSADELDFQNRRMPPK